MDKKSKIVKLHVFHHDCAGSNTTQKFPTACITLASQALMVHKNGKLESYEGVVELTAETEKELGEFIESLKKNKEITFKEMVAREPTKALVIISIKGNTSSYETLLQEGALPVDRIKMEKGYDVHKIVTRDYSNLKSILKELDELGEVHIKQIGSIGDDFKKSDLTPKQLSALENALRNKYYSWPRKETLDSLAEKNKMSRRAYQENLRKAESKVFPKLLKHYLETKNE